MPELPEVETIRLGLQKQILGLQIKDIEVLATKTFPNDPKPLIGQTITGVWRRAKVLGIDLTGNLTLIFHLKMTGQVIYDDGQRRLSGGHPTADMRDEMPNKSTRVIFSLTDGSHIYFNDQRKFGWVKVIATDQIDQHDFLKGLGPEPLDKKFTVEVLKERVSKRKSMPIKVAIMEQQLIAGVGNIYASEACFDAGIDPRRKVATITDEEYQKLHQGIISSLKDGIKYGGSSRAHYVNSEGEKGLFLDYAYVYGRDGDLCKKCGTVIHKTKLAGRGTFYCPTCQK